MLSIGFYGMNCAVEEMNVSVHCARVIIQLEEIVLERELWQVLNETPLANSNCCILAEHTLDYQFT